jgi:hypothetical protein
MSEQQPSPPLSGKTHDALKAPFDRSVVEIKPAATSSEEKRALALPYVERHYYCSRLDAVLGPGNWMAPAAPQPYTMEAATVEVWIREPGTFEWLRFADMASGARGFSKDIASESASSLAFKRACSLFGLGRYLYELPKVWVDWDPEDGFPTHATKQFWDQIDGGDPIAPPKKLDRRQKPGKDEPRSSGNGGGSRGPRRGGGRRKGSTDIACPRCLTQDRGKNPLYFREAGTGRGDRPYPAFLSCALREACNFTANLPGPMEKWGDDMRGHYVAVIGEGERVLTQAGKDRPKKAVVNAFLRRHGIRRWSDATEAILVAMYEELGRLDDHAWGDLDQEEQEGWGDE